MKGFQSDGGIEFLNGQVKSLFAENGTRYRILCPCMPEKNGCVERKHRHIIEAGLAMLFNANAPDSFWVDAFALRICLTAVRRETFMLAWYRAHWEVANMMLGILLVRYISDPISHQ